MSTIQYSPMTAIYENKAPVTAITGMPGVGKTFFILNTLARCLMMNMKILAIDPKNDIGVLSEVYDNVEYININDIKDGALNPFKVIKNFDSITLSSIIDIMVGGLTQEQEVAVKPILNDKVNEFRRGTPMSFTQVADYLYQHDDKNCQYIGTRLNEIKNSKYGKLIFEDFLDEENYAAEETIDFFNSDTSKVISIMGMDLPKKDEKMTAEYYFNAGIVYIICRIMKDVLVNMNGEPCVVVIDEARIAFSNESFTNIINDFAALGRSLHIATILGTQSVVHYPDSIEQNISSKFCFRSTVKDGTEFLNRFFDMNSEYALEKGEIAKKIAKLQNGQCFFIDSNNRGAFIKIQKQLDPKKITTNPLKRG